MSNGDGWVWDPKTGEWGQYKPAPEKKNKKVKRMLEVVLPRPELFIGAKSHNILLRKGTLVVYVKIVNSDPDLVYERVKWYPMLGAKRQFKECKDLVEYMGPIDDDMLANILIFG